MKKQFVFILILISAFFTFLFPYTNATATPPLLWVSPGQIDFSTATTQASFKIANCGDTDGCWKLKVINANGWVSIDQKTICVQKQEEKAVTITVSREGLAAGIYQAAIELLSYPSGESDTEVLVSMEVEEDIGQGQQLELDQSILIIDRSDDAASVVIKNAGTGNLMWNIGSIEYNMQDIPRWLTVCPSDGSLSEGAFEMVTITANKDGLSPGLHQAIIDFDSNGGKKPVAVMMWKSRFAWQ